MAWAPDYITTEELKASLRISDTVDDAELPAVVTAASRAIDQHCNRQFGKVDAPVQRFWRDAHAGRVHAANDPERAYMIFGNHEFGLPPGDTMV